MGTCRAHANLGRVSLELRGGLSFEMEGTGLMNNFPSLVTRDICYAADNTRTRAGSLMRRGLQLRVPGRCYRLYHRQKCKRWILRESAWAKQVDRYGARLKTKDPLRTKSGNRLFVEI
jgi:hypothetical protein